MRVGAGRTPFALALVAAATVLVSAACGAAEDSGAGADGGPAEGTAMTEGTTPGATGEDGLVITVTSDPDDPATAVTWELTCEPAGGTHPDPEAACAALEAAADALEPVAADAVCTMIYGGDAVATITGTWNGAAVDASFNLRNGCEIARWKALVPLLPETGAAGARSLDG